MKTTVICDDALRAMREMLSGLREAMDRSTEDAEWFGTDSLTTNGFVWLMREAAREWRRLLRPGGHVLCFIDWRMYPALSAAVESVDLRHLGMLVWDKTYFGMGQCFRNQHELVLHFSKGAPRPPQRRDVGNVLRHKPVRGGDHPTQKPVELLRDLVSVTCPPGGTVLDCFAGSGATGRAAAECGCSAILIEIDPGYAATASRPS